MIQPLFVKYVLPFFQWYALMILLAIAIDYVLHHFQLVFVGRYLGLIGTLTICASFAYSLRKRKIIESGSPKKLLAMHEYLAWTGSIMLLVHAGIHFNAVLPWLAVLMLLIAVASGLVGKFLLKKANESLKERRLSFINSGISTEEVDKKLLFDSITVDLMKKMEGGSSTHYFTLRTSYYHAYNHHPHVQQMKKLIVLGIVMACIVLMNQFPHAMLNPGDLVEAHQNINNKCLACHDPFSGISNDKCISCHKLSTIGMDTIYAKESNAPVKKVLFHQYLSNQKCTACHTDHKGEKPEISLSSFNHEMLPSTVITKCNNCHSQPTNQLHKQVTTNCKNCHSTEGWKSSVTFNHDMIIGVNKNNCASCHLKPNDPFHQQVIESCDKCHSTDQWKPSTFDHSNYFQLDENHNAKCNTCHINNNFSAFTCYGCHEHTESNIREEHHENGIYNYNNCATCHKSGNEHDIRMNGKSSKELNESELNNMKKYIKSKENNNKGSDHQKEQDDD